MASFCWYSKTNLEKKNMILLFLETDIVSKIQRLIKYYMKTISYVEHFTRKTLFCDLLDRLLK